MKRALAINLASLALLLGACTAPRAVISAGSPDGDRAPAVATIKGDAKGPMENFMGDEIRCQLQSIDGNTVDSTYQLTLGRHTLIVTLGDPGKEHVGVVELLIPAARSYRVTARQRDDAVTVSLVEENSGRMLATSTAPVSEHMKFNVFVVQK